MKTFPSRKPHAGNAGFVCELKCKLGGHVVVYDREAGFDCSADYRWIVMHEPSSLHVAIRSQGQAREIMKGVAKARSIEEANGYAQIIPQPAAHGAEADDDGAAETVLREARLARRSQPAPARARQVDAAVELRGDDAVFRGLEDEAVSKIGESLVHLGRNPARCGVSFSYGFHRYPDQHPARIFRVCAACLAAASSSTSTPATAS